MCAWVEEALQVRLERGDCRAQVPLGAEWGRTAKGELSGMAQGRVAQPLGDLLFPEEEQVEARRCLWSWIGK